MDDENFEKTNGELLKAINKITSGFIASNDFGKFFERTLEVILSVTESEYGFLSELLNDDQGKPFMRAYAISNISWNPATQKMYQSFKEDGYMDFHAMDNLFGYVLLSGEPLLSNSPMSDSRSAGFPKGHRSMDAYLGIPLLGSGKVLGMVAIANRPGGYQPQILEWLEPVRSILSSIIISMRNERHRVLIEKQLIEAKEASEKANEAKSLFLATMSHEIRTPMNAIVGMCDLLRDSQLTGSQTYFAEVISRNSDLLLSIINDVLDMSKLEAGKMDILKSEFNLEDVLVEVAELTAYSATQKGISLMMRYPEELARDLISDHAKIKQILINLVSNAVKFTDFGHVLIEVKAGTNNGLQVQVKDTGIGISEKALPNLFGLFHQADQSASRRHGGTGLGLAISQRFARLLGGEIKVQSEKGVGSCFILELPESSVVCTSRARREINLHGARIHFMTENKAFKELFLAHYSNRREARLSIYDALDDIPQEQLGLDPKHVDILLIDADLPVIDVSGEVSKNLRKDMLVFEVPYKYGQSAALSSLFVEKNLVGTLPRYLGFKNFDADVETIVRRLVNKSHAAVNRNQSPSTLHRNIANRFENTFGLKDAQPSVLLVEDNPINQDVASLLLTQMGCSVDIAFNGVQGLEKFQRRPYDLIFMDCQMPIMDGLTATGKIREIELQKNLKRTPIVAITANALSSDRDACLAVGMDDYLAKPFKRSQVKEVLERHLISEQLSQAGSPESEPSVKETEVPVFDIAMMLEITGDDWNLASQIASRFQSALLEQLKKLTLLIEKSDLVGLNNELHKLRGGAAGSGFVRFAAHLQEIESELKLNMKLDSVRILSLLRKDVQEVLQYTLTEQHR